ncbi:glycosyltransferase family 4 protein [Orrella sp. NBD-18]|uniref:Glycosyltransferase family 4 protein n=1 Tax=Sheuella amnicola TaxID=2707330 RepID=A0A6B2R0E0_9BURK|nr:glycosyltransferase [Sheuella amnicola]NDY83488.1 glycosyltransferase family 4 protein [Sheuella amnicola]
MVKLKVAVDASRVRSGGGVAHLIGILDLERIDLFGIAEIHLWSYQKLLDAVPDKPWLIKHHPPETEASLPRQLLWQAIQLEKEIKQAGCQILFSADASTVCRFSPMVALSQNMLPYEEGIMPLYGFSKDRLRQAFILEVQKRAFKFADASIFLTQHAATRIQLYSGNLPAYTVIPHGVGEVFKQSPVTSTWPEQNQRPIHCLYVSPILEYKHQWVVVQAIKRLRDQGLDVTLTLLGGGGLRARQRLARQIEISDPDHQFVEVLEFLPHEEIPRRIAAADIFIFASGCETFGISLLEAMAVGVPIACSNQSSLPETLQDGGEYFNPRDDASIAQALKTLIDDPAKRAHLAARARKLSESYSWSRCASETWRYIVQTYQRVSRVNQ